MSEHKPRYSKNRPNTNRTPQKFNKPKGRHSQPHKKAKVVAIKAAPTREYNCTECKEPVVKKNRCGVVLATVRAGKKVIVTKVAGLGRFKCSCGNNKVSVKILRASQPTALKVAA